METSVTKYESRTRLRDDPREEYVHRSKHEELLLPQREAADGPRFPNTHRTFCAAVASMKTPKSWNTNAVRACSSDDGALRVVLYER